MRKILLILVGIFSMSVSGQIKGKVVDQSNQPLVGAHVHFQKEGTLTGTDGTFELKSAKQGDKIHITYIGFDETDVTATDNIVVTLKENASELQEVGAVKNNLELPSYDLVDTGISYKMLVGKNKKDNVTFRLNVNNLFDEVYLSELTSNIKTTDNISSTNAALGTYQSNGRVYNGIADGNQGYFGFGRTWNFGLRYNF